MNFSTLLALTPSCILFISPQIKNLWLFPGAYMKTKLHRYLLLFQLYFMTLSLYHTFLFGWTSLKSIIHFTHFSKILRPSLDPDQFPTPFKVTFLRFPVLELSLRKFGLSERNSLTPYPIAVHVFLVILILTPPLQSKKSWLCGNLDHITRTS